jgi:hypothetical protein
MPGCDAAYDAADVVDVLLDDPRVQRLRAMSPYVEPASADDDAPTLRAHWVGHLAVALTASGASEPLLLVLDGAAGALAPALGFAQKAARRSVGGYVLVDAALPSADARTADWPDAPVHYVASPAAHPLDVNQARLRGWHVHEIPSVSARHVAAAVAHIATF